jgi:hypothetical protein
MSFHRTLASILLTLAFISLAASQPEALQPAARTATPTSGLPVPITGVADLGGMFEGALLIDRFAAQPTGIVAIGTVSGALTASGTVRNLVVQVTLPLDINASRARLNTDPNLAQASCDVLHVELGGASINVLGSTVALNPVAFDVASALQATGGVALVSTPTSPGATASGVGTLPPPAPTGTVTPSTSAITTRAPTNDQPVPGATTTPGVVAPTSPTTAAPTTPASQTPLGALLCSVDRFRNASDSTQLVQQLNGILAALSNTPSS